MVYDPLMLTKDFYSVTEVADLLGVSRQAILDRINRTTLHAIRIGEKAYAISRNEVQRVIKRRKP